MIPQAFTISYLSIGDDFPQDFEDSPLYYVPMSDDFHVDKLGIPVAPNCVVRLGETKSNLTRYQLVPQKRTDANIAAIEKRRKELLGES